MARHRPRSSLIINLLQENTQIRELQQENKELRLALEEHQSALEMIMRKYRQQVFKLVLASKLDKEALKGQNAPPQVGEMGEYWSHWTLGDLNEILDKSFLS